MPRHVDTALAAPDIAAIPTTYRGQQFRSRTEARWALFFDSLKLPWDYEPQGYQHNGHNYLPDFWLPYQHIFFEVKGADRYDLEKTGVATLATGFPTVIAFGEPAPSFRDRKRCLDCKVHRTSGLHVLLRSEDGALIKETERAWGMCSACGRIDVNYGPYYYGRKECVCDPLKLRAMSTLDGHTEALHRAYRNAQTRKFWK